MMPLPTISKVGAVGPEVRTVGSPSAMLGPDKGQSLHPAQSPPDRSSYAPRARGFRVGGNIEFDFMRQLDDVITVLAQCVL